jgi:protocatechuate 3,4-dioxygenase beta subunit
MSNDDRDNGDHEPAKPARRDAIKFLGGALLLLGCGSDSTGGAGAGAGAGGSGGDGGNGAGTCAPAPDETLGPYPDKLGMLTNPTYNRSDITENKAGVPLTLVLSVVGGASACAPVKGAQVIVWQCDAEGHYSEYGGQPGGFDGSGLTYLRGVQTTDADGQVTFKTIYPGWYQGRATHVHVEVLVGGVSQKVTQLAFPEAVTAEVYASGVYAAKGANPQSNATDMVFADSLASELATLSGDTANGYTAALTIGVTL